MGAILVAGAFFAAYMLSNHIADRWDTRRKR